MEQVLILFGLTEIHLYYSLTFFMMLSKFLQNVCRLYTWIAKQFWNFLIGLKRKKVVPYEHGTNVVLLYVHFSNI